MVVGWPGGGRGLALPVGWCGGDHQQAIRGHGWPDCCAGVESRADYDQLVLLDVALVGRGGGVV